MQLIVTPPAVMASMASPPIFQAGCMPGFPRSTEGQDILPQLLLKKNHSHPVRQCGFLKVPCNLHLHLPFV